MSSPLLQLHAKTDARFVDGVFKVTRASRSYDARYFEVEPRFVELTDKNLVMTAGGAAKLVDENTIAVVAILGSTYTGEYEDVPAIARALAEVNERTGWQVRIHVDAASGGFVAPFTQPDLAWDFREPLVARRARPMPSERRDRSLCAGVCANLCC